MINIQFDNVIKRFVVVSDPRVGPTPDDPIATQADILQFAADTELETSTNPQLMNDVIESLTVEKTPDNTIVEEGVESVIESV
tara:strand:- start:290 stop:538 length:249 start_codon:yes stop_codon:yes gene_type:complete